GLRVVSLDRKDARAGAGIHLSAVQQIPDYGSGAGQVAAREDYVGGGQGRGLIEDGSPARLRVIGGAGKPGTGVYLDRACVGKRNPQARGAGARRFAHQPLVVEMDRRTREVDERSVRLGIEETARLIVPDTAIVGSDEAAACPVSAAVIVECPRVERREA